MILISGFLIFDNWRNEGKLVIGGLPNARHERLGAGGFDLHAWRIGDGRVLIYFKWVSCIK